MAILNSNQNNVSDSTNSAQAQGQEQDVGQASQPAQRNTAGGPGEALNSGSSFLGDANGFLNQLNQLLQNPIVQQKVNQNMGGQEQAQGGEQVMDNQAQGPEQAPQRNPRPKSQNKEKRKSPEIRPEDIDTLELFQAKLFDSEQRQELIQGLEQIGALVDEELNGMDTSLQELKEYLDSDKFEKEIGQMKEAGLV